MFIFIFVTVALNFCYSEFRVLKNSLFISITDVKLAYFNGKLN